MSNHSMILGAIVVTVTVVLISFIDFLLTSSYPGSFVYGMVCGVWLYYFVWLQSKIR